MGDDNLVGGLHSDACYQGSGPGQFVTCEKGSLPPLAIAYTDMDGNHAFGPGDAMISSLVDTDGDKEPSEGDTVVMGRYATKLMPTSAADFERWKVRTHDVLSVGVVEADAVTVLTTSGGSFKWLRNSASYDDVFAEANGGGQSSIGDQLSTDPDHIDVELSSPSYPSKAVDLESAGTGDDRLMDVELNFTP